MQENFEPSLVELLKDEGGNDDDPADHGGRTSRGITQREYNAWRKEQGLPPRDVWTAADGEVRAIYKEEYWEPWCDSLPQGVDYLYFNMAVNAGPFRATVLLQRALGVNADGRIGPITRAAVAAANPRRFVEDYTRVTKAFYQSLHQPRFIRGWLNRADHARAVALAMLAPTQEA